MSKHSSMTILSDVELDAVTGAGGGQSQTNNSQTNQSTSVEWARQLHREPDQQQPD